MKNRKISINNPKSREVEQEYSLNLRDSLKKVKFFIVSLPEDYRRHKREFLLIVLMLLFVFIVTFILMIRGSFPDNESIYKYKRAQEKFILDHKTESGSRADYYEELLDNRFKELNYLGKNNLGQYISTASSRYSTTLGELSELIVQNNLSDQRKKITQKLPEYKKQLKMVHDSLFVKYGVIETLDQRWYLQRAMDSSDIFLEKLQALNK